MRYSQVMAWHQLSLRGRAIGSYSKVQSLYSKIIRDRRWQYGNVDNTKRYLNVGPGANIEPAFVNVDYGWRPGIDLCLDIAQGIHFPASRFRGIYTEHCLEHVTFDQCVGVLRDFYRMLEPGGRLRVIVPDGGLYLDLYQRWGHGERHPFPYVAEVGALDLEEDSRFGFTPMMAVNRIFRGYGHLFAWDFPTMEAVLRHVGFADIIRTSFRQGADPVLLVDSELRRPQSLYVEASKP